MIWNKNLNAYYYQGIYWAIFNIFTYMFLDAYAIHLGASNFYMGIFGALPFIAVFLAEIPGALLGNLFDHRKITVFALVLNRFAWVVIILSYYFFPNKILLLILILYFSCEFSALLSDPAWTEIVAEVIPKKIRGEYTGYRERSIAIAKIIAILVVGFFIERIASKTFGYNVLFSFGVIFGLISVFYIWKINIQQKPQHKTYTFKDFFDVGGQFKNFLGYSFYFAFAQMIASPFFVVFLLKDMGVSLSFYSISLTVEAIASIFAAKRVGIFSDKYGDKLMHTICLFGASLTPLLYLLFVTPSTIWVLIPISFISGFAWGGYNLTKGNLLLDATDEGDREVSVAMYRTLTSIPMFIAPLIGGFIADNFSFLFSGIPLIFAISFILRISSVFFLLKIPETRVDKRARFGRVVGEFFHLPLHTLNHSLLRRHFVIARKIFIKRNK